MSCTVRRTGMPTAAQMLPLLIEMESQGVSGLKMAARTGLDRRTVRNALQRWHEREEDEEAPPSPLSILPRRSGMAEADLMPPPEPGRADLPGYDAWEMVHVQRLDVRTVARRLGLRYASQVFELLAQHKLAVEAATTELSVVARKTAILSERAAVQATMDHEPVLSPSGERMLRRLSA